MSEDLFKDEEVDSKKVDFKLLKRLLKYTKPHLPLLILCIILIFLSSIADIGRPYLMKVAIDDYVEGYKTPMYVSKEKPNTPYIKYKEKYYIRDKDFKEEKDTYNKAQIVKYKDKYILIDGPINKDEKLQIEEKQGSYSIKSKNETFKGNALSDEDYKIFRAYDKKGVKNVALIFLLILSIGFLAVYFQIYILNYVGQKIIFTMRMELFSHVQRLSLSFFDKTSAGKIVTRLTNDMENINEMFTNVIVTFLKDISLLLFTMITMFFLNFKIALVCFSTLPLIILASYLFRRKSRDAHRLVKGKLSKINSTLNENIMGMKIIQIFAKEKDMLKEFDEINKDHRKASMQELWVFAIFRPIIDIIYNLTVALLIWIGARGVLSGVLEFGVLFAFVNYIEQFFNPIFDLSEKFNTLQSAMASAERVFSLLDTKPDIINSQNPIHLKDLEGCIEFKNVWFKYDKEWILKDVSFKIEKGEMAAFVGATGSGKTTIISLLTRLYDIQKGEILIDGINIKDLDVKDLRTNIGSVLQDVFLFTGTIEENIRLNEKHIPMEKVKEVSKFVNADKFIDSLNNGYNSEVKERGATFSAGQRQLLSFARALVFNPSILILDEATSNIDTETESLIQDAISKVIQNRTTIVVAHRLSTIQNADKIIVLHKGVVKEIGNHAELLQKKGMYNTLYNLQYSQN